MCSPDLFLGLIAILFPPLAVWVKRGICSADSIINILLCMLGYIPGLLHAWYIIAQYPDAWDYESVEQGDYEGGYSHGRHQGGVSYVVVAAPYQQPSPGFPARPQQLQPQQQPKQAQAMDYGTNAASSSRQDEHGSSNNNNDDRAPPTYDEAIQGDHKIQSHN
ncbi:hypothetical protein F4861DRAFT_543878 [Xylaria intraflava]|nr:hypothetical protein F4861DRAFT_543878 [Xylaria intraflava]